MDLPTLTRFFLWCTLVNGGLLLFWTALVIGAPDLVYHTQKRWFPLSREAHAAVMYGFLGLFKILFLVFNLVPLLALLIVA